jgi:hypothetical protein
MDLLTRLRNLITRTLVDSRGSDGTYQVLWSADRVSAGVEYLEPQGVHFRLPKDALGMTISPHADRSAAVLIDAQGTVPTDTISAGEGGLHYLGDYQVFLASDGTLSLGAKAATDWVALASLVDARLASAVNALNNHTHAVSGTVSGTAVTGTAAPVVTPYPTPATVASTKVRVS